jgi:predicted pyridoxine 5'-phosphate oxidase superfamily flavin-nucleotide-binding protein
MPSEALQREADRVAIRIGDLTLRRRHMVAQLAAMDAELEAAYRSADAIEMAARLASAAQEGPPSAERSE